MRTSRFKQYAFGEVYPLYTPLGTIPPFQLIIRHTSETIASVSLYRLENGSVTDITATITGLLRKDYADDGYDVILYASLSLSRLYQDEGRYYIIISMSDGKSYYSDIFTAVGDMAGFLNIMWWDLNDFVMDNARIVYKDGATPCYRNQLWLPTQLGKPDYEFTEEGEDRDGYFFAEKMISEKRYKCTFLATEYLCDVMRFIRMADRVYVNDQNGVQYRCDTFLITPKWQEQGNIASVDVEFTCDTVAKKIGLGVAFTGADFNGDYNNDFNVNI